MNHDLTNMRAWWMSIVAMLLVAWGAGVESLASDSAKAPREYAWTIGPQNGLDAQTGGHWFNLGPTGVRAKIAATDPRVFIVKYVFADSPAAGKIYVDDQIVGANGQKFQEPEMFTAGYAGPRMELGKAIEESEGDTALNGRLTFMVVRGGKSMDVVVQLRHLGYFSKTYPFDCNKSEAIIKDACDWITRPIELKLKPVGTSFKPGVHVAGHWHSQIACKLALMAQGETYMPLLKDHYKRRAETDDGRGASEYTANGDGMWVYCEALQMIELTEWYMLTKDKSVLAPLKYHESVVVYCQNPNGGFEHGKVKNIYPKMAFPAGLAGIGWALMKQAGIEINTKAYLISRTALTRSTQPSGEIWYDVYPLATTPYVLPEKFSMDKVRDRSSGVSGRGACAALMHFLDPMDKCSETYTQRGVAHLAACADMLMEGHASAALNAWWSFTAMSIAPVIGDTKSYREMMDYYKYWFNVNRCFDGSFYAPACTAGEIDPFSDVHYITTGWAVLALSAPKRSLAILGRDPLIPGIDKSMLSPATAQIYTAVKSGKGQPAAMLKGIISLKKTAQDKELAALELLESLVTKPMIEKLEGLEALGGEKDLYKLSEELKLADAKYKGAAEYDTRTTPLRAALGGPESEKLIKVGKTFYTRIAPLYDTASGRVEKKGVVLRTTKEFLASTPGEPYMNKANALAEGLTTELDKVLEEIATLQKEGDVVLASRKLLKADKDFTGFGNYIEQAKHLRDAMNTPDSKKQMKIGEAYYRIVESSTITKGKLLQSLDEFIHANGENQPYATMARELREKMIPDMELLVTQIAGIRAGGDVYDAWRRLLEADREYGAASVYVEKTRELKADLTTPANKELVRMGGLYYAMEEAVKKTPGPDAQRRVAVFVKGNEGNYYGEKAKGLITEKK